jgi:hypothetical protein
MMDFRKIFTSLFLTFGLVIGSSGFGAPLKKGEAYGPNGEIVRYVFLSDTEVRCAETMSRLGNGYVYGRDLKRVKTDSLKAAGKPADTHLPFFYRYQCTGPECKELQSFEPDPETGLVKCKICGLHPNQHTTIIHLQHKGDLVLHKDDLAGTDAQARAALSGAKWICTKSGCGYLNQSVPENAKCAKCGTSGKKGKRVNLSAKTQEIDPALLSPTTGRDARAQHQVASQVLKMNQVHTRDTSGGYSPLRNSPLGDLSARVPEWVKKHAKKLGIAGGVLGLGAAGIFTSWLFDTEEIIGKLQDGAWAHRVDVETFTKVTERGWESELTAAPSRMPVNGVGGFGGVENIRDCTPEFHHSREVFVGYEEKDVWEDDDPPPSSSSSSSSSDDSSTSFDWGGFGSGSDSSSSGSDWGGGSSSSGSDWGGGSSSSGSDTYNDFGNGGGSL